MSSRLIWRVQRGLVIGLDTFNYVSRWFSLLEAGSSTSFPAMLSQHPFKRPLLFSPMTHFVFIGTTHLVSATHTPHT